jgi:hypothetical protein
MAAKRNITDRAHRYRATKTPPPNPQICNLCGSPKQVQVGHVNGHEEDDDPTNLFWTCRSCNVLSANTLRKAGLGRLTAQYNPAGGATSIGQWVKAVLSMKGESDVMSVRDAVAMIRATSPAKRSEFAQEIWSRRRQHGNPPKRIYFIPVGKKAKRNPATSLFEAFHGRPPESTSIDSKQMKYPKGLEFLGGLMRLNLADRSFPDLTFDPFQTKLYSNKKGTQYYVRGKGGKIDLEDFPGVDTDKDEVDLGEIQSIVYHTDKQHLGKEDRKPGPYKHKFGEEGGTPPILVYDILNDEPKFVGGTYRIDWDMDGGRHSAGIRD